MLPRAISDRLPETRLVKALRLAGTRASQPAHTGYTPRVSIIEAVGLRKTYTGVFGGAAHEALRGLDLAIPPGVAFGLLGPNGAGKTTFIKCLLGVARPTAGTVRVLGGDPRDPAIRARIGYLPERMHLPDAATPLQFLQSVSRLKRLDPAAPPLIALLERVGLGDAVRRRIGPFSKGMKQRLGLAAALVGAPELLVLDEPTDGIDPIGRRDVRRILTEERERGATIFLNSHLLAETERVCDRAGILSQGRLVREGTLDELRRSGTRYRARFAPGADADALAAAGFTAEAADHVIDAASPESLNAALDAARRAGALLVSLSADARDLESVLVQAVEEAA